MNLTLEAPEHQEMNRQVEGTMRTLSTIAYSVMVHAGVSVAYINIALMYMIYHIFLVLSIKYLINKDGDPTTSYKLAIGTKLSISHLRVLFCPNACGRFP